MNDVNSVIVEGRLTRELTLGEGSNGKRFAFASMASNKFYKSPEEKTWKQKTVFLDIRSFEPRFPEGFLDLAKGDKVRFTGRIEADKDGKHYISPENVQKLM